MFKRIKKFYKRNRIYCILMLVSFVCLVTLGAALAIYFYNQTIGDPYGNRLEDRENYPVQDEMKKCEEYLKKAKGVTKAELILKGNIIWVEVDVDKELTVEDMQNIGVGTLEHFTEEQLGYYDLQYSFSREGYPSYTGSKSAQNKIISWSVYNLDYDKEETTTTTKKKK